MQKDSCVLSVIIPTFNRRDLVVACVQRLQTQTCAEPFEVIVAIDGSTDGTAESLTKLQFAFQVTVVTQANRGASAARNLGASRANGDLLLFLDDDILAFPSLIAEHLSIHRKFPNSVVVGPTPLATETHPSSLGTLVRNAYENDIARLNSWGFNAIDPYFCLGANGSLSKALFKRSGGFDESLQSEGDEFEIGLRLLDLGATFRWNPNAVGEQVWVRDKHSFAVTGRQRRAINEIKLLQVEPRFRVLSRVADLFSGPWLKVIRRSFIAKFPQLVQFTFNIVDSIIRFLPSRVHPLLEAAAIRAISTATFWKTYRKKEGSPWKVASRFNARIPILNYHLVTDDLPASDVVMPLKKFEKQMRYLNKKGYECISLKQWRDWIIFEKPLPSKPVILTFDDGFRDLYEHAWPILRRYGHHFTSFLVSSKIGTVNAWKGIEPGKLPLVTAEQIREMAAEGASFEAHSCTHQSLPTLDDVQLKQEIERCRSELSEILGKEPEFFAYPYGDFKARERKAVYDAGYLGACTTIGGRNNLRTDLYRMRRISISGTDTMVDFYLKLRLGAGLLSWDNFKRSSKLFLREQFGIRLKASNLEYSV